LICRDEGGNSKEKKDGKKGSERIVMGQGEEAKEMLKNGIAVRSDGAKVR
jgi:hypothetical protein